MREAATRARTGSRLVKAIEDRAADVAGAASSVGAVSVFDQNVRDNSAHNGHSQSNEHNYLEAS